jgi:biopolymer transport protein TolQ
MFDDLMGNSLWQLVRQSDAVSKLVLLILLGLSVACWTIFFYKWIMLRMKTRQLNKMISRLKNVTTVDQLLLVSADFADTMPGYFLNKNLNFIKQIMQLRMQADAPLNQQQWDMVQTHVFGTVDEMMQNEESYLPFLLTSAGVAPLLGLFGTVWGLVHAFIRISEKQSADITTVAPGIAEALITTLVGLMVAIPALIMYNYLAARIRHLESRLMTVADRYSVLLQTVFLR